MCRDSEKHTNHSFRPIDEAALNHKEQVQKSLKALQEKLMVFNVVKKKNDQIARYIKVQAQDTETQIKEQFTILHQFLQEEEKARISALRAEEAQKSQEIKEKIDKLNRDMATFSDAIEDAEEQLRSENRNAFLHNYTTTMELSLIHI